MCTCPAKRTCGVNALTEVSTEHTESHEGGDVISRVCKVTSEKECEKACECTVET